MNLVIDTILKRRSIRSYQDVPLKKEDLDLIIKCGLFAPSSKNKQEWHLSVFTNREKIDEINKLAIEGMARFGIEMEKNANIFHHAPCVIVVSTKIGGFSEVNIGCLLENIALAASALGYGACIIGQTRYLYHKVEKIDIDRLLKIPEGYEHDLAICLGLPKKLETTAKPRREKTVTYIE